MITPREINSNDKFIFMMKLRNFYLSIINSHRRCSVRKGILRNFSKFTGKLLCQSLFFNNVARTPKNTFFTEHMWATASKVLKYLYKIFEKKLIKIRSGRTGRKIPKDFLLVIFIFELFTFFLTSQIGLF